MAVPRYEWVECEPCKLKEGVAVPGAVKNAGEPMPLEVKRCEVLPTPPKKRTARIQVGGRRLMEGSRIAIP